jgi:ElaB/YqjD/DUF883 family membrane-anchored ribosome-binding protein
MARRPSRLPPLVLLVLLVARAEAWGGGDAHRAAQAAPGGAPRSSRPHSRSELTLFPYMGRGDGHHSFHHPYFPSNDGPVANWWLVGSALVTGVDGRDVVRLTNAAQGLQGVLHSTMHTETNNFNGYFDVKITSSPDSHEAADGMGFFFAERMPRQGSAMGMDETFRGLGVIVDTFANSRKVAVPYLYAYVSNGDRPWNAGGDGADTQLTAGCRLELNVVNRIFVQLLDSNLHVAVSSNHDHQKWHTCFRYNNVPMPFQDGGFMAFAGETGHFFASHDVHNAAFIIGDSYVEATETLRHEGVREQKQPPQAPVPAPAPPRGAAGDAGGAGSALETQLEAEVNKLYSDVSSVMLRAGGGSFAEAESLRQSFESMSGMAAHSFTEIERMTAETRDAALAIETLKQTSIDLHAYAERFSASLTSLHDSVRALRASNNRLRADHEETHMLVHDHANTMHGIMFAVAEASPHGVLSALVFVALQAMLLAGFAVVAKMGPGGRKVGRMV